MLCCAVGAVGAVLVGFKIVVRIPRLEGGGCGILYTTLLYTVLTPAARSPIRTPSKQEISISSIL